MYTSVCMTSLEAVRRATLRYRHSVRQYLPIVLSGTGLAVQCPLDSGPDTLQGLSTARLDVSAWKTTVPNSPLFLNVPFFVDVNH